MTHPTLLALLPAADRALALPLLLPEEGGDRLALTLPPATLTLLARDFTLATDTLLTTTLSSAAQLRPASVLHLTQVLGVAAGDGRYRAELQEYRSLFINTVYLLRMVHQASRSGAEGLGLLGKIKDADSCPEAELREGPGYCLLVGLVRLLTNLVWGHQENQSLACELETVALVLDCTAVDARNPLVTQWAVLAVRALTEGHPGNQAVLAGLRREGAMDGSLLQELGLARTS